MTKAKILFILLTILCVAAVSLVAAERPTERAKENRIATAVVANSGIDWKPNRDYESASLVVTGPDGEIFRGEFAAGAPLFYDFLDTEGNPLRDGTYHYELVFSPVIDSQTREEMQMARETGDTSIVDRLREQGLLPSERLLLSGSFTLVDGLAVDPDTPENPDGGGAGSDPRARQISPQDQVILDDLIVDGSACIGFDCVNGESFGFDTLRLKENNLRIKFQDTSTSSGFPTVDWQITANDSASGGQNKFSIDDIDSGRTPFTIEHSAPSHSLYVDDGGRVGLGTSTPVVELHIKDGDSPTLRLEQDGSSGFTPQTWDVAGNETNFFVRDATNGSQLPFRIRPGADSNSIYIDSDNDVGMGTSSPSAALHVKRSDNTAQILVEDTGNGNDDLLKLVNTGFATMSLSTDGGTTETRITQATSGNFTINIPGAGVEYTFAGGNLTITGDFFSNTCTSGMPCAPDYVFDPDHELLPLDKLSEYIKQNKHLPDIPSAKELAGPVNVSKLQMKLLEKIEELTLYTLSQQDLIRALQERVAELEKSPPQE